MLRIVIPVLLTTSLVCLPQAYAADDAQLRQEYLQRSWGAVVNSLEKAGAAPGPATCGVPLPRAGDCDALASLLRTARTDRAYDPTSRLGEALADGSRLIVLGEDHWEPEQRRLFETVFHELKASHPELDCLFLEVAHSLGGLVEDYRSKGLPYEQLVSGDCKCDVAAARARKRPTDLVPDPIVYYWDDLKGLIDEAKASGVRIFAVDATKDERAGLNGFEDFRRRNGIMASRIAEQMRPGQCHGGIFIVGRSHVSDRSLDGATRPVQDQIRNLGIPVTSAFVFDTNSFGDNPSYTELGCAFSLAHVDSRKPLALPGSVFKDQTWEAAFVHSKAGNVRDYLARNLGYLDVKFSDADLLIFTRKYGEAQRIPW